MSSPPENHSAIERPSKRVFIEVFVYPANIRGCKGVIEIKFVLTPLAVFLLACSVARPNAAEISVLITEEQAIAIVWELSEVKAWARYLEEKTVGKIRGVLMVESPISESLGPSRYWAVSFYENQPTHVHRWQTFLVRLDGKEILVDDLTTGQFSDLQKWREKEKPLERVRELTKP